MRLLLANHLALIIVLISIGFSATYTIEQNPEYSDYLYSTPKLDSWETDSLATPAKKNSEATSVIAQDFIAIVLISDHGQPAPKFDHYLSIFDQERRKDYFLLI